MGSPLFDDDSCGRLDEGCTDTRNGTPYTKNMKETRMKRSSVLITIVGMILLIGLSTTCVWAAAPQAADTVSRALPLCKSLYKKKPVTARTLQELVRAHERWVEYRGNQNAKRMELCQADLSRAALAGANLERADLEGTVLRQANLTHATLDQASLAGADLTKAILKDGNLSGADLRRARLTGANLLVPWVTRLPCLTPSSSAPN